MASVVDIHCAPHNPCAMTNRQLLGTAEAAAELHVHRSTLTRMVQAGRIKPARRGTGIRGELLFRRAEVDRVKQLA